MGYNKDNRQLNSTKRIRLFFNELINLYKNDLIEADKFKNLCYGLNIYNRIFETSELEKRLLELENKLNIGGAND